MSPNAFIGKTKQPTDAELSAELGGARSLWDDVLTRLAAELRLAPARAPRTAEWLREWQAGQCRSSSQTGTGDL